MRLDARDRVTEMETDMTARHEGRTEIKVGDGNGLQSSYRRKALRVRVRFWFISQNRNVTRDP
jgi:hypothetical protein